MDLHTKRSYLFLCLYIIAYNAKVCHGTGVMEIRFHRFQFTYFEKNSDVESTTTAPSTTSVPWQQQVTCPGPPAYRFILCLDSLEHSNTSHECSLGRVDTGAVSVDSGTPNTGGMDTIFFGSAFGRPPNVIPNPMPFNFPDWPGGIRVKVYISCCPSIPRLQNECQEEIMVNYTAEPGTDRWSSLPVDLSLHQRSRLWLQVNLYCDPNYFGHNCSTHCSIEDPTEHFMCNHLTGEKECTFGWEGENCDVDIDECSNGVCQNDAACTNSPGKYTCDCKEGFSGLFCQYRTPGCPSNPCQNSGSCADTDDGYVCYCSEPFTGPNCESIITTTHEPIVVAMTEGQPINLVTEQSLEPKEGENRWYIIVIGIVLALLVAVILIICVIWSNRRKKYDVRKRSGNGPNDQFPPLPPRSPAYENDVYMSGDNKVSFAGPIPFGTGIFSNIGFNVPSESDSNNAQVSDSNEEGATGGAKNNFDEVDLKSAPQKPKRSSEAKGNVYIPWVPNNLVRVENERETDGVQMKENDLSAPPTNHEPVSRELSNHYAVSKPISELRKDMMTASPTGSLFSINRFRKISSQAQPNLNSTEKRKTSVSSLMGDIFKWSPRSRKTSRTSEVSDSLAVPPSGLTRRKSSFNLVQSDPDLSRHNDDTDDNRNNDYLRRPSTYELFEPSPVNSRFETNEEVISLSSSSSNEGINIPINITRCPQTNNDVENGYVHMSSMRTSASQLTLDASLDSRRPSASTLGRSVNASPVVSDMGTSGSSDDITDLESNTSNESKTVKNDSNSISSSDESEHGVAKV